MGSRDRWGHPWPDTVTFGGWVGDLRNQALLRLSCGRVSTGRADRRAR
jgi:hypothetical protein